MQFVLICLGGALGTGARYVAGGLAVRWLGAEFPYGTLVVNVVGSFLIGVVQHVALHSTLMPETARLVVGIGVLGGFTTYSSFSYETVRLLSGGAWLAAGLNVIVTTTLCLLVCAAGLIVGRVLLEGRVGL